jgi:hypothetical protein
MLIEMEAEKMQIEKLMEVIWTSEGLKSTKRAQKRFQIGQKKIQLKI